ncbi:amino acid adenylation domain-containing protein [Pseudomonas auratipiscis]|uniref:Amino acid adenylation domain-containing protein n=1 Tax=Pseudomonas auratipiscis TaxID=3115853 RepID=A0AB35WQ58_9PSED|nr:MULTISPECIES: amino acid adenylation domain-containing protein [unclassified Pseudomonas]MEE1866831.1 amino acid adenylation domain-containing protein [Pseudomonas sp. 120P]MEE1958727.1 amino acid adenylation domain-containing protein [Pseudomonas sp. 119P]
MMQSKALSDLIERFIKLPTAQRKTLYQQMVSKGVNIARLPIPVTRDSFERIALSFAQERQWFLWGLDPSSSAYNLPTALRLRGALDVPALQGSFDALVMRHESLRTRFVEEGDQRLQVVEAEGRIVMEQLALPATGNDTTDRLDAYIAEQIARPFDLQSGPLLRVQLLRLGADDHVLLLVQHHIVSDAWSMQVMVRELIAGYSQKSAGQPTTLPDLPIQYADYALWQRHWMEAGGREEQLAYWREQLGDEQPVLQLPASRPRPPVRSDRGALHKVELDAELGQALKALAKQQGVTLFMLMLAAFQALLHRCSGQDDIRVGVPIANRNRVETEGLIGFFVNTQVLRAQLHGELSFSDLLLQVKQRALGAQAHQDLPFEQLVDALQPERNMSHNPLFQVVYNHISAAPASAAAASGQVQGLAVEAIEWHNQTAQFDLALNTYESEQSLSASFIYATDLFDAQDARLLARHWLNLLRAIARNPQQRIGELTLLDPDQQQAVLAQWNPAPRRFEVERCLHQLIEQQAALRPQAIALTFEGQHLSYEALNRRANRLAHHLISQGVGPDHLVGLVCARSFDMLVAILAILKAGGAYVPLDPQYPEDRLAYMIEDSGIALLLGQPAVLQHLPLPEGLATVALDASFAEQPEHNPAVALSPDNLAYVIYTSGSTGRPKGTLLPHRNVLRLFGATQDWFGFDHNDVWSLFHSYAFDFSVWEIFGALLHGGRLLIVPQDTTRAPDDFYALLCDAGVSVLNQTPSAFRQLMHVACAEQNLQRDNRLRHVVFGGEALDVGSLAPWFQRFGDQAPRLVNMYGITETTVHVTYRPLSCADLQQASVSPIGEPIPDLSWYLLDAQLNPVPHNCIGELYVGRAGLARGYLNRADLTATRFIPNPFDNDGSRLYRTGDLARCTADGVIEYIGRIDHQVKIRGFRIELGEIEARLQALDGIRDAVVLAQPGPSGAQLVAYVVADDAQLEIAELKARLKASLPDYMVPAHVLLLERLPLTTNGKLDRKALPQPDSQAQQQVYTTPREGLEQQIAELWQQVLQVERVGRDDNFFELGGDSIISIQMVSRARQAGIRFTTKELFQHQSVARLAGIAQHIEQDQVIDQGPVTGIALLLPIQQWFFEEVQQQRHHWNQAVLLKPRQALEPAILEEALRALLAHHDALRLVFREQGQGWVAEHQPPAALSEPLLRSLRLENLEGLREMGEQNQRSLDLTNGPLLRAMLAELPDGSQRLHLVVHHLVVDGVSWRILFEDLQLAYEQLQATRKVKLPAKTSAFKHWAEYLEGYARARLGQQDEMFWQRQLQGAPEGLPCDNPEGGLQNRNAMTVHARLPQAQTRALLQHAPAAYLTQVNDLLLTALARVICRWTGERSMLVQLEGHGREELFDDIDLSRTVGWFTSMFPVHLTPADDLGLAIKHVKEQLRAIPDKGIGHGALRYLGTPESRERMQALPQPRITFNYLGQFDASFGEEQGALFIPTGDPAGAEQDANAPLGNWLTLNGQVYGGELSMGWTFSTEMFDSTTLQRLANDYMAELARVVEHCCLPSQHGVTPSDFKLANLTQMQLDTLPVPAGNIEDIYPLSPMQQGMLFHTLYAEGSGDYITQMCVDVEALDPEAFRKAWETAVDAHDILRSSFIWENGLAQPVQLVHRRIELPFRYLDWQLRDDLSEALAQLAEQDRLQGFDLSTAPLLRLCLVRTGENRHHLIYTHHHILLDGWSNSLLLGEVLQRYRGEPVPATGGRYRDLIAWLHQQDATASQAFWSDQFAHYEAPTLLAHALAPNGYAAQGHGEHFHRLDAISTAALNAFARQQKVTFNTVLQAAWILLLQRLTGQATVTFGTTVSGRPSGLKGIEQQVGLFINTLPVVASPRAELRVADWLQQVQAQGLALREQEHAPLYEIQRWVAQGGEALFDNILVFENYPVAQALQQARGNGPRFANVHNQEQTNYPLTLQAILGDELTLQFSHAHAAFCSADIQRLGQQVEALLRAMLANPQQVLGELTLLSSEAQRAAIAQWNPTPQVFEVEHCLHTLIERQATLRPAAIALTFEGQHLSYEALNRRANRLAHHLISQGVGPDRLVGLACARSFDMLVAILAILKAGGAYVPLDPQYPEDRLAYMIEDSGIALLLGQPAVLQHLPLPEGLATVALDASFAEQPEHNPEVALSPDNLAYVIYTSGSTGRPKGTLLPHRNVLRLFDATQDWFGFDHNDVWSLFHSYAFDFSVWEIFGALLHGGRLLIVPQDTTRAPDDFYALLCDEGVSVLNQTPSAFRQLMHVACAEQHLQRDSRLRHVVFGGEALDIGSLAPWFQRFGDQAPRLVNMYGITETTVHVTYRPLSCADLQQASVSPIGEPIADLSWYLLDAQLNPVPHNCTGELYVGRAGLARGYLNRADLTATRFIPNPFDNDGSRLYRTGDLARCTADGAIEYIGRIDHQVKIRGFRIELGEIEARLQALDGIRDAVVLAQPGPSGAQLVAYVVADDAQLEIAELKARLKASLPDYMVPAHVLLLERLPLTTNGKLDRKALPQPDSQAQQQVYTAPREGLEQQIAELWQQVLQVERVGREDDFFELGGHSLLVINLVSQLQLSLGLKVTPQEVFHHPVLGNFAASLDPQAGLAGKEKLNALEALLDEMEEV